MWGCRGWEGSADQEAGWEWGHCIWGSVSPWSRMATLSLAHHWGHMDTQGTSGSGVPAGLRPQGWGGEGLLGVSGSSRQLKSVSIAPSPAAPRNGWAPAPTGCALGAGGLQGHSVAHRSLQHPELWRQQSVGPSLRRRHRASEAGAGRRGRSGASPVIPPRVTPHLPAPPPDPSWL